MRAAALTTRHLMAAGLMALLFCLPAVAQDNPLVQRGIPAEATAENAVTARDRAHASARRIAFQRMMEALGGPAGSTPSDSQLENMVAAMIVEEERTTPTRYAGRLTVQFSAARVTSATGRAVPTGAGAGGLALNIPMATQTYMEATSRHASMAEWIELRRRLRASGSVASVEILALSPQSAHFRLGLRQSADEAAASLAAAGIQLSADGNLWLMALGGN